MAPAADRPEPPSGTGRPGRRRHPASGVEILITTLSDLVAGASLLPGSSPGLRYPMTLCGVDSAAGFIFRFRSRGLSPATASAPRGKAFCVLRFLRNPQRLERCLVHSRRSISSSCMEGEVGLGGAGARGSSWPLPAEPPQAACRGHRPPSKASGGVPAFPVSGRPHAEGPAPQDTARGVLTFRAVLPGRKLRPRRIGDLPGVPRLGLAAGASSLLASNLCSLDCALPGAPLS